jgi:general secretion pathway protein J
MNASLRRGFTLVELLVAIAILAIVSVLAWRGLSTLLDTRARLEPEAADVRALVATVGQLDIDLARSPARAALFAMAAPTVRVLVEDGRQVLRITRLCDATDGSGTHAVQTVQYLVRDGELVREHSAAQPFATGPAPLPSERDRLLERVASLRVRVWSTGVGWVEAGPATQGNPSAIEVLVERADGGVLRRVLEAG